ncbi:MAG: ferrous iron transport protein A [Planctomycetes bacterium]|nr:ferrous iron transport protein A [Planctomycetota bacterium]
MPIHLLSLGDKAIVEDLCGTERKVHRLREMGLGPGTEIEMVQPGSPCIIRLGEQRLCFRADESLNVLVALLPKPCEEPDYQMALVEPSP